MNVTEIIYLKLFSSISIGFDYTLITVICLLSYFPFKFLYMNPLNLWNILIGKIVDVT